MGRISAQLRSGRFDDAEQHLRDALAGLPWPVASACLEAPPASVEVHGWDELHADLVRLTRRGHAVTAVGLDLSNYNDSAIDHWWDKEPCVEFAAYTDSVYPFSSSTTDELLRVSESYAAPWTGGLLGEEDAFPTVSGLRRVNAASCDTSRSTPARLRLPRMPRPSSVGGGSTCASAQPWRGTSTPKGWR